MMKYLTAVLAMVFAISVNAAPSMADSDKQRFEKSDKYKGKGKHKGWDKDKDRRRDKDGYKDKDRDDDKDKDRDRERMHRGDPLPNASDNPARRWWQF